MRWLFNRLIFHLCVVLLVSALSLLCSAWLGSIWGFAVMALLWIPLMMLIPLLWNRITRSNMSVHWVMFLLIMLPVYACTAHFPGLVSLYRMKAAPRISAAEITNYPGVAAFRFSDGKVQTAYRHLRIAKSYDSRKSTTTTSYFLVAPITAKNWTPAEPVTAWAVCSPHNSTYERCDNWSVENGAGVQCDEQGISAFKETVRQAGAKHRLTNADGSRLLIWSSSIEAEKQRRIRTIIATVAGAYVGWATLFSIVYLFRGKKMREETQDE